MHPPPKDVPHVLLVNPWIHDFAAYDVWAKPLGLLLLAAILRQHGYRVSYIDCLDRFHPGAGPATRPRRDGRGPYRKTGIPKPEGLADVPRRFSRYGIPLEQFTEDLRALHRPDLILLTCVMTYWWTGVAETIAEIRKVFPRTPVLLGGIYATLCPDHAKQHSGADAVVAGPGEEEILALVGKHTGFAAPPKFSPADMASYPYPAFDLQHAIPYVPLQTSRGCPFSCAYCASGVLNPRTMRRDPASVVEEVRFWHQKYGVCNFALYDDAFLAGAQNHALPMLETIAAAGLPVRFHTPNALHIREISRRAADLMRKAGFETLRLGLETTDPERRETLDTKVTNREFQQAVDRLKAAGFDAGRIGVYLLVGLPGQTDSDVREAVRQVKRAGAVPIPAYYSPIPRTALWERAKAVSRYDLSRDPLFTNNAIFPCQKAPFSWETITRLKQWVRAPVS